MTTPTPSSTPAPSPTDEAVSTAPALPTGTSKVRLAVFVAAGLCVALALAFFVSPEASSKPDGLNKVAIDEGFADDETAHDLEDGPLAGYGVEGVDDERLSTGLSGIIGVAVTFALAGGAVLALRLIQSRRPTDAATAGHTGHTGHTGQTDATSADGSGRERGRT